MPIDASSLEKLQDALTDMEGMDFGEEGIVTAVKTALNQVRDEAKARVHSITGTLARAIQTVVKTTPDSPIEAQVGVSYKTNKKARYAHLVEGGHGGPHPAPEHPFFKPARDKFESQSLEALEQTMLDAVAKKFNS